MNTRTLEYIIAVYETKSFITASERCFVSQPALSMQIKKFEEYTNLQVFERGTKQVLITKAGLKIVNQAYKILDEVSNLDRIAEINQDGSRIKVSIGAFPTLCPYLMPEILPLIKKEFPDISISLVEEKTDILVDMLDQGKLDFAFLATPTDGYQFQRKNLFKDKFFVAVAKTNELSKNKSISIENVIKENLMILDEGNCLRDQTLRLCSLNSYNNNDFKGSSLETLRQMVSINEGVTLIPKIACSKHENIKYINIDGSGFYRNIDLVMRKSSVYSDLFESISNLVSKIYN
ncbi:oxidative stress transcriptional regulator OxyR [Francisella adeliensis]|uniref:Hydrogen peroxide-inducible protein activator n=1 Tax=Francisella adeliensis TaxID=2007306 RepID=A0A2Z4XZ18_9GAMM|nr:LysR substrate-binding domain-containing protein [Francisella adeliensis]AXA33916.1 hydrogen peroxide-inducible protein activator [Francisella adeliensis]MBK2085822.1 LysR family transcriptional regulator [Francisella adeliensis]MBK2097700.1 LysR family transcriptional regulator [Francisella adeliensis]QIW12153.1 LysR family transcriptional regulator [Francisella adeliensis]QIW14028.1 LysR family transcriptional regulator [Francisella adeliensis]